MTDRAPHAPTGDTITGGAALPDLPARINREIDTYMAQYARETRARLYDFIREYGALCYEAGRGALQAKIDRLMLEHCPEDMTEAQIQEWGSHQKPFSAETTLNKSTVQPQAQDAGVRECKHESTLGGSYRRWCGDCGEITHSYDGWTPTADLELEKEEYAARVAWAQENVAAFGCASEANIGKGGIYADSNKCEAWCGHNYCPNVKVAALKQSLAYIKEKELP